jgi:radical SAM superfamily enzyme YgiQ (UPF0313 family)
LPYFNGQKRPGLDVPDRHVTARLKDSEKNKGSYRLLNVHRGCPHRAAFLFAFI